jgi:hypothetical protein
MTNEIDADPGERLNDTGRMLLIRLLIGLAFGAGLYGLHKLLPAKTLDARMLAGAISLPVMLLPVAILGSVGSWRGRTVALWLGAAAVILALLGLYDGFVRSGDDGVWCSPTVAIFSAIGLFIAHHLVGASEAERRWIAGYERYFDEGWKDGVRLALSVAFVGALWLLLLLGIGLFDLIGLKFFGKLVQHDWFYFPVSTVAFALAVHLTDIQSGLVRGVRTVALTLLSMLSPVIVLIAGGFLAALPFTGLKPLWATGSAAAILLAACAALIILINATYQSGERPGFPPVILKWTGRIAALLIAPIVVIAAYGVMLRIGQYGLTPERVQAVACLVAAGCYGAGYAVAAVRPGVWLKTLEITNILTAGVVILILLAVFSPLADPQRLSVNDQIRRLDAGRISAADFDYQFLRFKSGRTGETALAKLAARTSGKDAAEIARRAKQTMALQNRGQDIELDPADRAKQVKVVGAATLPASFLSQNWKPDENPFPQCNNCTAVVADLNGDNVPEVVMTQYSIGKVYSLRDGRWSKIGILSGADCIAIDADEALQAGKFKLYEPEPWMGLEVNGRRYQVEPDCNQMLKAEGP